MELGWSLEQPNRGEGVPVQGTGLEWNDLQGPFQAKPFYDSGSIIVDSFNSFLHNKKTKNQKPKQKKTQKNPPKTTTTTTNNKVLNLPK